MGFMETLFGGTSSAPLWNTGQVDLRDTMVNQVRNAIGQGVPAYAGQITPGASQLQQQAFGMAPGMLGAGMAPGVQSAISGLLSGAPAYQIDPATSAAYYRDAVVGPMQQQFGDILRGLDARYGARFGRSGGQLQAANQAAERFGTQLAGIQGDLVYRDEMARRQALENAQGRIGTGVQAAFGQGAENRANLGALATLGGEQRAIAGQQGVEDYGKWLYSQPYNNPWLGFMGTALSTMPMMQTQTPGILPGLGAAAQGLGTLAGGLGKMGLGF